MSIFTRRSILKLAAIFMLVAMMTGAFAIHSSAVFAARAGTCNGANPIFSSGSCTVGVTIVNSVDDRLSFTSVSNVTVPTPQIGHNTFTFTVDVTEGRTDAALTGWQIQALLPDLTGSSNPPIHMSIDSIASPSCTTGTVVGTDCPSPTLPGTALTSPITSATTFADTTAGHDVAGTVHFTVNGSYTIPSGAQPDTFGGNITLSLLEVA